MEREVKTMGQYFSFKAILIFIAGIGVGVVFAVPLVERGFVRADIPFFRDAEEAGKRVPTSVSLEERPDAREISFLAGDTDMIIAVDQESGMSVILSMVSLEESGWVAIHEELLDGSFGAILGARRFGPGKQFSPLIELLRSTESGRPYVAALHADDGDSVFDFKKEILVKNSRSEFVSARVFTLPE